jgi:hypothetical protein
LASAWIHAERAERTREQLVRGNTRTRGPRTARVARLKEKSVEHQVQEDGVAGLEFWVGQSVDVKAILGYKSVVDVVKGVGPSLTDICRRK